MYAPIRSFATAPHFQNIGIQALLVRPYLVKYYEAVPKPKAEKWSHLCTLSLSHVEL